MNPEGLFVFPVNSTDPESPSSNEVTPGKAAVSWPPEEDAAGEKNTDEVLEEKVEGSGMKPSLRLPCAPPPPAVAGWKENPSPLGGWKDSKAEEVISDGNGTPAA